MLHVAYRFLVMMILVAFSAHGMSPMFGLMDIIKASHTEMPSLPSDLEELSHEELANYANELVINFNIEVQYTTLALTFNKNDYKKWDKCITAWFNGYREMLTAPALEIHKTLSKENLLAIINYHKNSRYLELLKALLSFPYVWKDLKQKAKESLPIEAHDDDLILAYKTCLEIVLKKVNNTTVAHNIVSLFLEEVKRNYADVIETYKYWCNEPTDFKDKEIAALMNNIKQKIEGLKLY